MSQQDCFLSRRLERERALGQFYTNRDIGEFLINQMTGITPAHVLDLGAGEGSLARAAMQRWSNVQVLTVDLNSKALRYLSGSLGHNDGNRHSHFRVDALSRKLPELISAKAPRPDAAVCNPPFLIPKWRKAFGEIVEEAGFSGCISVLSDVDAALLFLAQNLRLLSDDATLGIILPDSLVSASKYRLFRQTLLKLYRVHRVVRLPRRSFRNTDAQAFVAIISKGSPTTARIPLQRLSESRNVSLELTVDHQQAIERLDYAFHSEAIGSKNPAKQCVALGSVSISLTRGSLTSAEAKTVRFGVVHTTDMDASRAGRWCDLSEFRGGQRSGLYLLRAQPGDILLARVGRNLEHQVLGVAKGEPAITDCVLRLRVPDGIREAVLAQLCSPDGKAWLASRAYGVSARHIAKQDLLAFPLRLEDALRAR